MRFRILAGDRVEYPRVGSRKMAVALADETARDNPGVYVQVQVKQSRPCVWNPAPQMRWETVYGRSAGVAQ